MLTTAQAIKILERMAAVIQQNKDYLTELDMPIGDSDHGINLARGFQAVESKLPALADKDMGTIFKTVGMTLVSTVGGASGPLYGTAFMRASMKVPGKTELNMEDFAAMLEAAIDGVKIRGKSIPGEKTMLDAMVPAMEALRAAEGQSPAQMLAAAHAAAQIGVEKTKAMVATKGRASYLGERSVGHQDPGATSFTLLLGVVAAAVQEG